MTAAERIAYLGLAPADAARLDELMSMPGSAWPPGLHAHVAAAGPAYGLDHLACAVAAWIRTQPVAGAPC